MRTMRNLNLGTKICIFILVMVLAVYLISTYGIKQRDSRYDQAVSYMENGDYYDAAVLFQELSERHKYLDSSVRLRQCIEAMGHSQKDVMQ